MILMSAWEFIFFPAGFCLLFRQKGRFDFPDLVQKLLSHNMSIYCHAYDGYWMDIGRPEDYEQAIDDFEKMKDSFMSGYNPTIPLFDLNYGQEEEEAVLRVLRSKWLTMGPETEALEKEFAEFCGEKHAIALSNCTTALPIPANLAAGVKT